MDAIEPEDEPRHNAFRDGLVHVMADKCSTCIFRPGNLMRLQPGRVKEMVEHAKREETAIICHKTLQLPIDNAICRGYYDSYAHDVATLRLAMSFGIITFDVVEEPQQ